MQPGHLKNGLAQHRKVASARKQGSSQVAASSHALSASTVARAPSKVGLWSVLAFANALMFPPALMRERLFCRSVAKKKAEGVGRRDWACAAVSDKSRGAANLLDCSISRALISS